MSVSDKIRDLCKEKRIPLSRIEKDLGFSNGYIRTKKGDWPASRLSAICEYLDVDIFDVCNINDSRVLSEETDINNDKNISTSEDIKRIVLDTMKAEQDKYYFDPEAAEIAQELKENPGMRVLFDACRKVPAEDMAKVARLIRAYTDEG